MTYWKYYGWRYGVLIAVGALGYADSGISGMLWALLGLGVVLFVLYTALDGWNRVTRPISPEAEARLTTDDYMGMYESYKHRQNGD